MEKCVTYEDFGAAGDEESIQIRGRKVRKVTPASPK